MTESVPFADPSSVGLPGSSLGTPSTFRGLTVFPLIPEDDPRLPYDLLADAIASGNVSIREIGSGTVPNLLAHNSGSTDVLILDGEQLIGAKQNRITNRSILLAAGAKTEIPVSCMEQGRWHFTSEEFAPAPKARHAPSHVRRHARVAEAEVALATGRGRRDSGAMAQGPVWDTIDELSSRLGGRSETGAMDDVYDRLDADVDSWMEHFPCVEGQVGLVALLGARPMAVDSLGCSELWARVHRRFLGGYVMDALAWAGGEPPVSPVEEPVSRTARRFLDAVGNARRIGSDTVGSGEYNVLAGPAIGGELVAEYAGHRRIVHLSAFPSEPGHRAAGPVARSASEAPLPPPSRRRPG